MTEHYVNTDLVDDEISVTDSLTWLLDSVNIKAIAFNESEKFLEMFRQDNGPSCVVLDLRMPGASGLEVMEEIMSLRPDVPVTFLSAHGDIPTAVRSVKKGALDFLQKPFEPQLFIDTINRMMRLAVNQYEQNETVRQLRGKLDCLSPREREILTLLVDGMSSKEVGRHHEISPKTVDVHRANIMRKLGVANYRELIHKFRQASSAEFVGHQKMSVVK